MGAFPALSSLRQWLYGVDWLLVIASYILVAAGLVTMNSFTGESPFFARQLVWTGLATVVFLAAALSDVRFLRRTSFVLLLYGISIFSLILILFVGPATLGAQNRFDFGFFSFQPADPAQLILVILLAKYFSRRHVEIANFKHILVSGCYSFVLCFLLFLQPDFGSAVIVASIWFGMVLVSGISKKHLFALIGIALVAGVGLWSFALADYQKQRIFTFLDPLADIQGTGYNAYQSTIAVGSGQIFGKGIGYGTQSKLEFLPEYETDFIFAAFAEEWGFIGVVALFMVFGILYWRLLIAAQYGATNFETLVAIGVTVWFFSHFIIHVGMNIGLLPVTGTTIPFLSYGGSHLLTEFLALGIVVSMSRYARSVRRDEADREIEGFAT